MKNYQDNNGQAFHLTVTGMPITKGSVKPYTGGHGRALPDDPRLTVWQATIMQAATIEKQRRRLKTYQVPVTVATIFTMPRPIRPRFPYPATQARKEKGGGDLDKLCRAVGDALEKAGIIQNDALIVDWQASKRYANDTSKPGVTLIIAPKQ
ncbi:RusA family crossover junction endodeoxyribonuclease [Bifidobacterium sp.]|uniref:RusA family crossover junction endodeoxyribonuclease n=1 Tax=Bifidobacterium sp. TaxID=41200 RepID=UPI0039E7682B